MKKLLVGAISVLILLFINSFVSVAEQVAVISNNSVNPYPVNIQKKKIASFYCDKEYPSKTYFQHGDVKVVDSPIGKYREAEGKPLSRFGYRFYIKNTGKPHLAVIKYPDDKRRYMCIMDGTSYDLTTGVFTGYAQPVSGNMLEVNQVFWPRWKDCTIIFMTWGNGEPAAVQSVKIYELDGLPEAVTNVKNFQSPRRDMGIQYEDPCGTGCSEGAFSHEQWTDRVMEYMKYSGQRLLIYPIVWYHGPRFPNSVEPADHFECVVGEDRKQYARWTTTPPDWVAYTLKSFGKQGLEFQGAMTMLRLGSLMKKMNIDRESVNRGDDTINNVLKNGMIQAGTQDWTPTYNSMNYTKMVEFHEKGLDMGKFPWAYGEKTGEPYHGGPMFNPLHPVVKKAILDFINDTVQRYKTYPAFKGITINVWHSSIIWYGSLDSGYDDYTVGLFQKETGIKVPGDDKDPERFAKRYEFLTGIVRPAWIEWRCKKIHGLVTEIKDTVKKGRPDLNFGLTFWTETTVPQTYGPLAASHQLYAREGTADFFKDGGMDVSLYKNDKDISMDIHLEPQRDRGGWLTLGADTPLDQACMFRDHDFLDEKTKSAFSELPGSGAFIFNGWVEAWGVHKWFSCEKDDKQAKKFSFICGEPAEGIFRMNSEYPKDGFWYNSQLRITPAFQGGVHFMEHYAYAVAEYDAMRITRGGLFLDKAHTESIIDFARAYKSLPAEKFLTVGTKTDPVAVRTLVKDGVRYIYAVNRDYYPITVNIRFENTVSSGTDLVSGLPVAPGDVWQIELGPYQLRSFVTESGSEIKGFDIVLPEKIISELDTEALRAVDTIKRSISDGYEIPGSEQMAGNIEKARKNGEWAFVRRALNSYIVKKCGIVSSGN